MKKAIVALAIAITATYSAALPAPVFAWAALNASGTEPQSVLINAANVADNSLTCYYATTAQNACGQERTLAGVCPVSLGEIVDCSVDDGGVGTWYYACEGATEQCAVEDSPPVIISEPPPPSFISSMADGVNDNFDDFALEYGGVIVLIVSAALGVYGIFLAYGWVTRYIRAKSR